MDTPDEVSFEPSVERAIFQAAMFFTDPLQRARYLAVACEGNESFRRRMEALLSAAEDHGSFMQAPPIDSAVMNRASRFPAESDKSLMDSMGTDAAPNCQQTVGPAAVVPGGPFDTTARTSSPAADGQLPQRSPATDDTGASRPTTRRLDRYELIHVVGTGAFGTVYKARDPALDRIVAIKVPRAGEITSNSDRARFQREARSAASLRHPSIVTVYEPGQHDGTPFLVSEFVEGTTLDKLIAVRRPAPREAAQLAATLADALHYAHQLGVVHRDVTPANVMLDRDGRPRLMDFGLAKRESGESTMTLDGQILGTPAYMSPEQAQGQSHRVDGRTDVYSLGVILYQLLTGELPFRGTTRMLLHQVLHAESRPPRTLSDAIPRDLETICLRAMHKEPSGRYGTAKEMADDLRRFLTGEPIRARAIGHSERLWRWCRRQPALAGSLIAVALLAAAIAIGGTAVVGALLLIIAAGGTATAVNFRRQVKQERRLRSEADENLYYHRIALSYGDLTANLPRPGRAEELLDACPPNHRNWEWYFLKRLWRTEPVVVRDPESQEFRGIAFSHDGSKLAAACGDGRIRVWDEAARQMVNIPGHQAYVYSVAFDPSDNNRLASSGNDGWIRIWDLKSGKAALPPLTGLKVYAVGMAYCVAFSPDGRWLSAASERDTVHVWDAATGQVVYRLEGHELWAGCVAFSPDGRVLATGSWQGVVRIWDVSTGRLLQKFELPDHAYPVACVAFSPDGSYLAAGYFQKRLVVWDIIRGELHRDLRGHSGYLTSVAFHPLDSRRLASAGEDRAVRIWDVPGGREVLQLKGHIDNCSGLAFSPKGWLLASASYDRTIRFWNAGSHAEEQQQELHTFDFSYEVWTVAISPDGTRVAAGGMGPTIRIWDTRTASEVWSVSELVMYLVFSLAFSPDGRQLSAAGSDQGAWVVKIFDLQSGKAVQEHRESQEIFATRWSPDGQWLAIGLGDGSIKIFRANTGDGGVVVGKHDRSIAYGCVRFHPDGHLLASASLDGTVCVWDLKAAQGAGSTNVLPSPNDLLRLRVSTGSSGIAFWSVSYHPDGRHLVTGDKDGQLVVWDAETGEKVGQRFEAARGAFLSAAYSPLGKWIVSASEDCVARVYDAESLELVHRFLGHVGPIHCLDVGDQLVVTGGRDHLVKIWSLGQWNTRPPEGTRSG